jgi:Fur family peroxide stress response transcriptional regulator
MSNCSPEITADKLRQCGYRATPQRLAIYDALCSAGNHPTVEQIHECALKRDPTISLATVYKTLQVFTEIGLAREMGFRNESTRYDPKVDFHINVVCRNCGKVEDFEFEALEEIPSIIASRIDFEVQGQSFEVYGLCSKCRIK